MAKRRKKAAAATPQPPAPAPAAQQAPISGSYDVSYTPTTQSQLVQPYLDSITGGALSSFPNVMQNVQGQQDMAQMFGQGGAQAMGSWQQGTGQENALTGQMGGQAGGTLGSYGNIMGGNNPLIQGWQRELAGIQAGNPDFDPMLTQQWNQNEQQLRDRLQQQLGPDYATSSAGINALNQFQQEKTTSLTSAQFQRGTQLQQLLQDAQSNYANQAGGFANIYGGERGQAYGYGTGQSTLFGQFANDIYNQNTGMFNTGLTGAGQNIQNIGGQQNLMTNPALSMGQIGGAMTGQGAQTIAATQPYQQDRMANFTASTYPSSTQFMGQMMAQSGNRWADIGASTGGFGASAAQAGAKAGS